MPDTTVLANDIPVAYTPDGGWQGEMPPPILAGCTEPLVSGAPDMRGLWQAYAIEVKGQPAPEGHPLNAHTERVEQCGNRVIVVSSGIVHDMRCDGTLENGVNDVSGAGGQPIHVAAVLEDGKHVLRPNNGAIAVTRAMDGDVLVWTIVPVSTVVRMRRV